MFRRNLNPAHRYSEFYSEIIEEACALLSLSAVLTPELAAELAQRWQVRLGNPQETLEGQRPPVIPEIPFPPTELEAHLDTLRLEFWEGPQATALQPNPDFQVGDYRPEDYAEFGEPDFDVYLVANLETSREVKENSSNARALHLQFNQGFLRLDDETDYFFQKGTGRFEILRPQLDGQDEDQLSALN